MRFGAYVAKEQGVQAAERLVDSLTSRFSSLAKNPGMGQNRSEFSKRTRTSQESETQLFTARIARGPRFAATAEEALWTIGGAGGGREVCLTSR